MNSSRIQSLYEEVRLMDVPTWKTYQEVFNLTTRIIRQRIDPRILVRESASDIAQLVLKSSLSDLQNNRFDKFIGSDQLHFFGILANKVRERVRHHLRKKRNIKREEGAFESNGVDEPILDQVIQQELAVRFVEFVSGCIKRQPEKRQLALTIKFLNGLDNEEVLEVLFKNGQQIALRTLQLWNQAFLEILIKTIPASWDE